MEGHVKINKNCKKVYPNEKIIYKNLKQNLIINETFKIMNKMNIDDFFNDNNEKIISFKDFGL